MKEPVINIGVSSSIDTTGDVSMLIKLTTLEMPVRIAAFKTTIIKTFLKEKIQIPTIYTLLNNVDDAVYEKCITEESNMYTCLLGNAITAQCISCGYNLDSNWLCHELPKIV